MDITHIKLRSRYSLQKVTNHSLDSKKQQIIAVNESLKNSIDASHIIPIKNKLIILGKELKELIVKKKKIDDEIYELENPKLPGTPDTWNTM